jgi:hypothetical protein
MPVYVDPLILESRKAPIEVIVVDGGKKVPKKD